MNKLTWFKSRLAIIFHVWRIVMGRGSSHCTDFTHRREFYRQVTLAVDIKFLLQMF